MSTETEKAFKEFESTLKGSLPPSDFVYYSEGAEWAEAKAKKTLKKILEQVECHLKDKMPADGLHFARGYQKAILEARRIIEMNTPITRETE